MTFSTLASPGVSLQGGGGSGGGGGGTPGGSNTQIQYNSSGTFAGASGLTTNGTELTVASGTQTADAPVLNMSQTWNNGATTFTAIKMNVTDTASNAASLLMDLQVGGSSRFNIKKNGDVTFASTGGTISFSGSSGFDLGTFSLLRVASVQLGGSNDLILGRRTSANLRLGAADAAAPVAQTLSVQSVVAGTSNTAGQNFTITGSQGTGTGAGGSIVFQVAPAGSSGTAQNALATALTIDSTRRITFADAGTQAYINAGGQASFYSARFTAGSGFGSPWVTITENTLGVNLADAALLSWCNNPSSSSGTVDLILRRDAANTLALRNGANAQTFRVYSTFTDASNYVRSEVTASSVYQRAAGTGLGNEGSFEIGNMTGTTNLFFRVNGGTRVWYFGGSTGHFLANLDNTYDIGASGANRPRNVYVAGDVTAAGAVVAGASQKFQISGRINYSSPVAGVAEMRTPALGAGTVYLGQNTVANLPSASSYAGALAFVSDATATTARSTVAGGGSNKVMVMSDGTNWLIVA